MYVPDLVTSTNRKFIVTKMQDEDFVDIDSLNNVFPKKVKCIRTMQILQFKKSSPGLLHFKNSAENLEPYSQLSLRQKDAGKLPVKLPTLQPTTEENSDRIRRFSRINSRKPVTLLEMQAFLAVIINMGLNKKPTIFLTEIGFRPFYSFFT